MRKQDRYQQEIESANKKFQVSLARAIEASKRVLLEGTHVAFIEYRDEMQRAWQKYQGPKEGSDVSSLGPPP